MRVLITGATGNVGQQVITSVNQLNPKLKLLAGMRDVKKAKTLLNHLNCEYIKFDFEDRNSCKNAISGCDVIFLLRPPQISDVKAYFEPIIEACNEYNITHIIFLSVQGVEKSSVIPHYKIENLIVKSEIPYTFLRPAYFMQNFTTTLKNELRQNHRIFLPAGGAKFTLIDVRDIGDVTANILKDLPGHAYVSYDLTSNDKLSFKEMANIISKETGEPVSFVSPNLINFIFVKLKQRTSLTYIFVLIMLHYLPRFQDEPELSLWVKKLSKKIPTDFRTFVSDHKVELFHDK